MAETIEILSLISRYPGLTGTEIQEYLKKPVRNDLSDLLNRSCVFQDRESFGFYISPGGRYVLGQETQLAAA